MCISSKLCAAGHVSSCCDSAVTELLLENEGNNVHCRLKLGIQKLAETSKQITLICKFCVNEPAEHSQTCHLSAKKTGESEGDLLLI